MVHKKWSIVHRRIPPRLGLKRAPSKIAAIETVTNSSIKENPLQTLNFKQEFIAVTLHPMYLNGTEPEVGEWYQAE
jgi:hypothetical protein